MVERKEIDLEIEPETLEKIHEKVSDTVDPKELASIASETCTTKVEKYMKCGVCNRIPVEPVICQDDNCE